MNHPKVKINFLRYLTILIISIIGIPNINTFALASESIEESKKEDFFLKNDVYIIGPGDILNLKLFDAPDFSGTYSVLKDGSINLPLIGSVYINNLTLGQATSLLQRKYKTELIRPELHLNILVPRPIRVSIIGEIERPGIYSLTNQEKTQTQGGPINSNSGVPTLVDAFQKAGGITQNANLKEIRLIRKLPGYNGKLKTTKINLLDLIFNGNQEQNPYLYDGDVIKISSIDKLSPETMTLAQANLSPQTIKITVIGQVTNPGRMEVYSNTPLVQAVLMAGGPVAWQANTGNVELIRINRNGSAFRKKFKINLSEGASSSNNPPLMNKDIINVNSSILSKIGTGVETITKPISGVVSAYSLLKLIQD